MNPALSRRYAAILGLSLFAALAMSAARECVSSRVTLCR
jgi:hypothetical protein